MQSAKMNVHYNRGDDIKGLAILAVNFLSRNPKLHTLHSRFPRVIGNSAADHRCQVGTAGARAVVGQVLMAGVKAVATTTGGGMAASYGVGGGFNPGTQTGWNWLLMSPGNLPLAPTAQSWHALRETRVCGFDQQTLVP